MSRLCTLHVQSVQSYLRPRSASGMGQINFMFNGCSALTSIDIPEGVTIISNWCSLQPAFAILYLPVWVLIQKYTQKQYGAVIEYNPYYVVFFNILLKQSLYSQYHHASAS